MRKRGIYVLADQALNMSDVLVAVFIPGTGVAPEGVPWSPYPKVPLHRPEWWREHQPPPDAAPSDDEALLVLELL